MQRTLLSKRPHCPAKTNLGNSLRRKRVREVSNDPFTELPSVHDISQGIGRSHPDGKEAGQKQRMEVMRRSNPAFVLRESAMSKALEAADQGGATSFFFSI